MSLYTAITIMTLLFLLAGAVLIWSNRTVSMRARRVFAASMGIIFLETLITFLIYTFVVTGENHDLGFLIKIYMCITFAILPFVPVMLANVILPESHARAFVALLAAHGIFELLDVHFNIVFHIDENNLFQAGPCHMVYIFVYSLSIAYLVLVSARVARTFQSAGALSIIAILACMGSGIIIQVFFPRIYATWTSIAMGLVLYFQLYSDMVLKTDALTKLLNRHAYDEFLLNPDLPCAFLLIDVDSFKHVNDNYGHAFGDTCLATIASFIRNVYGASGLCYRIGGDEFAAIVTTRLDKVESMSAELKQLIAEQRAKDARIPTVSIGYAIAQSADELERRIQEADTMMYQNKRKAAR